MARDSSIPFLQNLRIDFQFDRAAFDFKRLPVKIPYPVPFKLLGDETKVLLAADHFQNQILLPNVLLSLR